MFSAKLEFALKYIIANETKSRKFHNNDFSLTMYNVQYCTYSLVKFKILLNNHFG